MTKIYLIIIAISWLFIGITAPYTYQSIREHIVSEVQSWPEMQASYTQKEQKEMNAFMAVSLPSIEGIN